MTIVTTGVEWVNTFDSAPPACANVDLGFRNAVAEGFQSSMSLLGHIAEFDWGEGNAWPTDFTDPARGGDSIDWSDNVNFCYFADHGGQNHEQFFISFNNFGQFNPNNDLCWSGTILWQLGAKNLKWIVFDCCDAVLDTPDVSMIDSISNIWFQPLQGVHLIFGYVNESTDCWYASGTGTNFGFDAGLAWQSLANAWLGDGADWWIGDTAISMAVGATADEAVARLNSETIEWRDFDVTASNFIAFLSWNGF
jgi:hypothetical protein